MALVTAIGLMSGTSMDGIDVALVRSDGAEQVERGPAEFFAYASGFRARLIQALEEAKSITEREERPGSLSGLEAELDDLHARAVDSFLSASGVSAEEIDVIGYHGHTVLHRPAQALTVQLGSGRRLAEKTGVDVVFDMRANDMVHGGQGAPLVPAYHAALAASLPAKYAGRLPVAFVNIGGIANLTWIAPDHDPVAFDTGPGNALIDQMAQAKAGIPFDDGGRIGSEGGIVRAIVDAYLGDPYYNRPAPKSLDRNDFTPEKAAGLELADGLRTLAAVTAEAIYAACEHLPAKPKLWILTGGGRKNSNIVKDLEGLVESDSALVISADEAGLSGDAMEAEAWAYLAIRSLKRLPLTWPTTTGCSRPVSGGVLARHKTPV